MWATIIPFIRIAVVWLGRIGLVAFAVNEIKKLTGSQQQTIQDHTKQAEAEGLSPEMHKQMIAATTYEQVEKSGKDPNDFWAGLTDAEKAQLEYSPTSVLTSMNRTRFLGTAQTILWIGAAIAAGVGGFRGFPATMKWLGTISEAKASGASAATIANLLSEMRTVILSKTWIPGMIAGIAAGGGWLTGALANNMNDAFLWGPTFLDQAARDVEKASAQVNKTSSSGGTGLTTPQGPRTIIRMVEEKKPTQFLGTLFSAKLGKLEHFDRKLDDEITDMDDLETDVKINVNQWLKTLPGRMGYSIVIRKDPVDETGVQQSGIWATATLHILQISGKILPIDTILLGPVAPQVRLELAKSTKTVETQIDGIISANEIREIDIPNGVVDIFNPAGERVYPSGETTPTPAPTTAPVKEEKYDTSKAIVISSNEEIQKYTTMGYDIRSNPNSGGTALAVPPKVANTPTPTAPATTSGTTSTLANAGTLRTGNTGEAVRELQTLLNSAGENLTIDGSFGPLTEAAVKRFQSRNNLAVDGLVGPQTKTKLFAIAYGAGSASLTA